MCHVHFTKFGLFGIVQGISIDNLVFVQAKALSTDRVSSHAGKEEWTVGTEVGDLGLVLVGSLQKVRHGILQGTWACVL